MPDDLVPPAGRGFRLADYDTRPQRGIDRKAAEDETDVLRGRLNDLQDTLYADRRFALLVVLQGIDTAGKDGTIRSVFRDVGPLGCSVANFGVPTDEEKAHDFLWRYHHRTPEKGKFVIFNRSHYEGVIVERVRGFVPKERWEARYGEINAFEAALAAEKTVIMKFFLHLSNDEQRERLQERIDNPKKHWKFRAGDLDERKHWGAYQEAFEDMIARCNTPHAPWHVVPADAKWYRDLVVARALVRRLEDLDLRYPPGPEDIRGLKVK